MKYISCLSTCRVHVAEPVKVHLGNGLWLHSVPPPGSGIILAYILNIMENYNLTALDYNDPLMYHRLVEAYKWGYAYRSKLGDPFDANITHIVNHVRNFLFYYQTIGWTFLLILSLFSFPKDCGKTFNRRSCLRYFPED